MNVLLVSSSRNLKRHVTRALASAGFSVHHTTSDQSAVKAQLEKGPQMSIVDVEENHTDVEWLLQELYHQHKDVICLIISPNKELPFLQELLRKQNLNNLIAKHGAMAAISDLIDERELIVTCNKLLTQDIFGIEKYLSTWGIKIHEFRISDTKEKRDALYYLDDFLDQIDCIGAIKNAVLLAADELLMNAIFNAPRDEKGHPKYVDLDRNSALSLAPQEHVKFQFCCDGSHVALSVCDNFGSLDRGVIMSYMQQAFRNEPAKMEKKDAGAGLGLYMVFNSITQLTFNIQAGVLTEAVAMFYVRSDVRAFKASGRSLNIFFLK